MQRSLYKTGKQFILIINGVKKAIAEMSDESSYASLTKVLKKLSYPAYLLTMENFSEWVIYRQNINCQY
jgi:hypothetical protein